jgi:hypothetical protein
MGIDPLFFPLREVVQVILRLKFILIAACSAEDGTQGLAYADSSAWIFFLLFLEVLGLNSC